MVKESSSKGLNVDSAGKNAQKILVLQVVGEEDSVAFSTCLNKCNEEKMESKHKSAISLLIA